MLQHASVHRTRVHLAKQARRYPEPRSNARVRRAVGARPTCAAIAFRDSPCASSIRARIQPDSFDEMGGRLADCGDWAPAMEVRSPMPTRAAKLGTSSGRCRLACSQSISSANGLSTLVWARSRGLNCV